MTETTREVENNVREAIQSGDDIYQQVRDITLKALTERELDMENIKSVIQSVSKGINTGLTAQYGPAREAFKQSTDALDDALASTAEASKLAIEEAASRVSEFSQHDLNQATEDLKSLEGLFLDTMSEITQESNEVVFEIAQDFLSHARNSGTAVGRQTQTILDAMNDMRHIGQDVIVSGTVATTATLAKIASGFLSGIAESLQPDKPTK